MNTEYFKEKLLEEKAILQEELEAIALWNPTTEEWDVVPEHSDDTSDENDNADRFEGFEERTAMVKALGARMKDIVDALKKIEGDNYGICEISGEPIEEDRLNANPAARTSKKHMNP